MSEETKIYVPDTVCRKCRKHLFEQYGTDTCPMRSKTSCTKYMTAMANYVLTHDELAKTVPVECLATALRAHGYSGELTQCVIVQV